MSKSSSELSVGPRLEALLAAQRRDEETTSYPLLVDYAHRVAALCRRLGGPVLWPVGSAAERLAGATVLVSEGGARVRGWSASLSGTGVLLLGTVATSPLELVTAASHARALDAAPVHACAIDVLGIDEVAKGTFDSFSRLGDLPLVWAGPKPVGQRDRRRAEAAA